jgi:hypothetical protein
MENLKIKKHITLVGAIQIGFSVLGLIGAVAIFAALNFARGFTENDEVAQTVLRFISVSIPMLVGFLSILGLVGGIGLLAYKLWARYLILVIAAIGCINIPFGTIKGVYSLWVLLQDDAKKLFSE